jgi:hypothetical protein
MLNLSHLLLVALLVCAHVRRRQRRLARGARRHSAAAGHHDLGQLRISVDHCQRRLSEIPEPGQHANGVGALR